jgi:hypothetical protein
LVKCSRAGCNGNVDAKAGRNQRVVLTCPDCGNIETITQTEWNNRIVAGRTAEKVELDKSEKTVTKQIKAMLKQKTPKEEMETSITDYLKNMYPLISEDKLKKHAKSMVSHVEFEKESKHRRVQKAFKKWNKERARAGQRTYRDLKELSVNALQDPTDKEAFKDYYRRIGVEKDTKKEDKVKARKENLYNWKNPLKLPRNLTKFTQDTVEGKVGSHVMSVITALSMIIAGMVISQLIEGTWAGNFTLGFIFLGVSTLLPKPMPIEELGNKVILTYWSYIRLLRNSKNNNWAGPIKSALKFFAVWFFITGARSATVIGFLGNIVMIVVAALAYFSFSSEFNQKVPGQIFEAVAKFFIGMIVIPWWVFYGIFQSFVLGLMAMAFFAVPPVASKASGGDEGESTIRGEYSRWLFLALMIFALAGSGFMGDTVPLLGLPTWGLTGALKSTFFYFWLVTAIAGFFSPSASRPAIGFIMLSAATMIYAVGPGTQEVGSALLGPWFGKVYVGLTEAMTPVTEAFGQIGATMGTAFSMIFNPVGFAQGIMSGSYTRDTDTGLIGAFGVEVDGFRATPIYANQPYSIIIPIENKGSTTAKNIVVKLFAGAGVRISKSGDMVGKVEDLPQEDKNRHWHSIDINPWGEQRLDTMPQPLVTYLSSVEWKDIKDWEEVKHTFTEEGLSDVGKKMNDAFGGNDELKFCGAEVRDLEKLDMEQVFFSSRTDSGIPCSSIVNFGLLTKTGSKFLPFTALVTYDYSIESSLQIEAISGDEWSRLAQEGLLYPGQKKPSTMANSPVMLNIGTLEQPIREGTPFFIAFNLTPAIAGKGWIDFADVRLEIPTELAAKVTQCTTEPQGGIGAAKSSGVFMWVNSADNPNEKGTFQANKHAIYCYFSGMPVGTTGIGSDATKKPTETYYINAKSNFRYNDVNTKVFAVEFGGAMCCETPDDCPGENPICEDYKCGAGGGTNGGNGGPVIEKGDDGFCESLSSEETTIKCPLGYGGCLTDDICEDPYYFRTNSGATVIGLECWTKEETGTGSRVCCPETATRSQCAAAFNAFMDGEEHPEIEAAYMDA